MSKPTFGTLPHKDLISISQLSREDIELIYSTATILKARRQEIDYPLAGKKLAMIFEKDSLRTRFTFDVGMQDLGGSAVFMDHRDARIGSRESIKDVARNLERWVDCVVARTFKHKAVIEFAENCSIPVINGLTDSLHPCQALSDFFTLREKWGDVKGKRLCYIGDGNNTCHSLIHAAAKLGTDITICTPEGYEPSAKVVDEAMLAARDSGAEIRIMNEPREACEGANAVYTDVWASMGQEDEIEERAGIFRPYQVDEKLMELTDNGLFMHCLPAHRVHEVTAGVMDGEQSIVFDIAENRLHVQKAIMLLLINKD